jgi:hypothetical protein
MDNLRAFDESAEPWIDAEEDVRMEAPPEIGFDERRMHVRAYNYWVSLLGGRTYPSIKDLEPHDLDDFGPHSVLLDFTGGSENPSVAFVGRSLRQQCGLGDGIDSVRAVPARSLLSRLTDHYLQIIANCAPIGFEAEFQGRRGMNTMYRGILMPFSSDGDTIDFIYGVINWKEVADSETAQAIAQEVGRSVAAAAPSLSANPIWADGPHANDLGAPLPSTQNPFELPAFDDDQAEFQLALPADAELADRLHLARESAEAVKSADARSRTALYRALGQAYDFALAADAAPEDYAEILEDAGLTAQVRAPMTPIVKLIFGAQYDKARVTEFAAALSYGRREDVAQGDFTQFLEGFGGGLKAMVAAERKLRKPEAPAEDRGAASRAAMRTAPAQAYVEIETDGEEFILLVARREPDGRLAVLAPVADQNLVDRALRTVAR